MDSNALILLLATAATFSPVADSVATFSRLGPGDELRVHFRSEGFAHGATFRLIFCGAPWTVHVSRVTPFFKGSSERLPTDGFMAALNDSDVAGLDSLLSHYRTATGGDCAAGDHIELSRVRDGTIVGTESFIDRSRAADHVRGIVSLRKLIERLSWAHVARRHAR